MIAATPTWGCRVSNADRVPSPGARRAAVSLLLLEAVNRRRREPRGDRPRPAGFRRQVRVRPLPATSARRGWRKWTSASHGPRSRGGRDRGEPASMPTAPRTPALAESSEKAHRPLQEVGQPLVLPSHRKAGERSRRSSIRRGLRRPAGRFTLRFAVDLALARRVIAMGFMIGHGDGHLSRQPAPPTSSASSTSVMCVWRPIRPNLARCPPGKRNETAYLALVRDQSRIARIAPDALAAATDPRLARSSPQNRVTNPSPVAPGERHVGSPPPSDDRRAADRRMGA